MDDVYKQNMDILLTNLKSQSVEKRLSAAETFSFFRKTPSDERVIPALIQALGDTDERVRFTVLYALERYGDKTAILPIIKSLGDTDPTVCSKAVDALEKIGHKGGEMTELELLEALSSENWRMRANAAHALSWIAPRRQDPSIFMDPLIKLCFDGNEEVCKNAIHAIRSIIFITSSSNLYEMVCNLEKRLKGKCDDLVGSCKKFLAKKKIGAASFLDKKAEDKGILLTDKPKPPKKGPMYQTIRKERVRNG